MELTHLLSVKSGIEINLRMWDDAVATSLRNAELSLTEVEDIYQVADAREAMCYVSVCYGSTYCLINAATIHPALPDSVLVRIFPIVVKTQGHVLDWLAERQEFLKSAADTSMIKQLRTDYVNAMQHLTDLLIRGPGNDRNAYRAEVAATRRKHDQADLALSAASEQLRRVIESGGSGRRVSTEALADALDPGATLIQFICYYKLAELVDDQVVWKARNKHYGAFRLEKTGAHSWDLEFVDLGNAKSIDSLVFDYRRTIDQMKPGYRPSAREETEYRTIASRLYEKVWAPVIPLMDEMASTGTAADSAAMVFLVPDSWLHLLDFNSLLAPNGELVIERWKVHHLSSGDDLLYLPRERPHGTGLLAVGNPTRPPGDFAKSSERSRIEARSSAILCDEAYRTPAPLPGAEREIRAVAELFAAATREPVTVLLGPEATEASVKRHLTGKRAVHVATHGFFCEENERTDRATVERLNNPLLMSGLVLAPDSPENDGLLTAQELVGLDLSDLDWVVLSACGSGLGRLMRGEGLFGLRRAFEIAGARTIVMALWRIDDVTIRDLMVAVYRFRFEGDSTVDAIRRAQLERLREQRRRLNRIHPILWGGIVAQGDWR
jgi:CHAT domain-containing protein